MLDSEVLLNMVKYLVLKSFIFVLPYRLYFHKVGLFLPIPEVLEGTVYLQS